jgi:hypothetical protein
MTFPKTGLSCTIVAEMQRALAISLILVFGMGPLSALIGDSEDASLPACCRRHGEHHCAMASSLTAIVAASTGSGVLTVPSTCPNFPSALAATASSTHALTAASVTLLFLHAELHSPLAARASARMSTIRTREGRAPPVSLLA